LYTVRYIYPLTDKKTNIGLIIIKCHLETGICAAARRAHD